MTEKEILPSVIDFWISLGILMQFDQIIVSAHYCPAERLAELQKQTVTPCRRQVPKATNTLVSDSAHLHPMIIGFLTNLGPSTTSNLHRMLAMLCAEPFPYKLDEQQLEHLMAALVGQDVLEFDGTNNFKIKK